MAAFWRQWWSDEGWRKRGSVAFALVAALLLYQGHGTPARGQESPLPTPPPAEAPAVEAPAPEAPPAVVPVTLPSISGVIRNSSGEPLAGMVVVAFRRQGMNWITARQTTTNSEGGYRFPWMPAGTYRLLIRDPQQLYASTYYPNAADIEDATDVIVTGTPLVDVNAEIVAGGEISGTLSWPDGPDPFNSVVELYYVTAAPLSTRLSINDDLSLPPELRQYRWVASQSLTETVASFHFAGLAPGRYRVCAEATALQSAAHECFDDAALGIHSTDVVVTLGAKVENVEIELGDAADRSTLLGIVTLADETPAAGVDVHLAPEPGVDFFAAPQPRQTTTNDEGLFRFDDLPFGRYVVSFSDADGLYLRKDYRASADEAAPSVIEVGRSSEVTISTVITAASLITGYVTIDGVNAGMNGQVTAYGFGEDGWFIGGTGNVVAATGMYTVTNLREGSYRLEYRFDLPTSIYYGDIGATLETANEIPVTAESVVPNINLDLTPYFATVAYGSISGQVLSENVPQADIAVRVYDANLDCCVAPPPLIATVTDAEGRFSVTGLPPGRYKVGAGTVGPSGSTLYAPDQRAYETAMTFSIGSPADGLSRQSYGDVNIMLGPTGSVARIVRRPDDTPVVGATVNLYQRVGDPGGWPWIGTTVTDEEGRYTFAGVIPDIYQVCIVAVGLTESTCGGRNGQGFGLDVLVTAGQEATGVDILDVP